MNIAHFPAIGGKCSVRPFEPALSAWLETQSRVVEFWLDRLVGEGGDPRTIAVLQTHAAFLREAAEL